MTSGFLFYKETGAWKHGVHLSRQWNLPGAGGRGGVPHFRSEEAEPGEYDFPDEADCIILSSWIYYSER